MVTASKVLTERVHHNKLEVGQGLHDLLNLVLQQQLVALVENADEVDAR